MPLGIVDVVGGDLPLPVGGGVAIGVPPSDVDVLVERVPFWLAIDSNAPYQRETAQFQRDQIDNQPEAGEQTLAGWWTRSQMSFHFGAGLEYLDTTARPQPEDRLRFATSRNVDVWTPGTVTRLNGTEVTRAGAAGERTWVEPFDSGIIIARPGAVEVYDGTTWTTRNVTSTFPVKAFAVDGVNYYVATADGVWTAPIAGTAAATQLYTLPGSDVPMCLGWVKQRLMLGHGPDLYALDQPGPALPTANMSHPSADWTWSTFSDGPTGILAGGYAGLSSAVYTLGESVQSGTPVLDPGVVLVTLPQGEQVLAALLYVGSMLVLGTSRGVRVCPFSSFYGSVTLGPLTTDTVDPQPVTALGGFDRYVFAGTHVAGETSLVRVDLSAPLDQNGHFAWAPDLVFPTGAWTEDVTAIAFGSTGLKLVGVTTHGLVSELDHTDPADSAWLQTARIRMGTVEDKHWLYGQLRGTYSDTAPIGVSIHQNGDTDFASIYVAMTNGQQFGLRARPAEWLALRFDFSEGAELSSYVVKALPAGQRQRLISLPVHVSDYQVTRSRVTAGYPGWALDRLNRIEQLEETGEEITVSAPALFPQAVTCVIEKLTYVQPSDPGDTGTGTGGVLQIILRTTA